MARPLRIELPDGVYHVTSRGLERKGIFRDDYDRQRWLDLLAKFCNRCGAALDLKAALEADEKQKSRDELLKELVSHPNVQKLLLQVVEEKALGGKLKHAVQSVESGEAALFCTLIDRGYFASQKPAGG